MATAAEGPPADRVLIEEEVPGGAMWSRVLRSHQTLRFIDVAGGANAGVLLYNADLPLERYNMPDTLKAQHTAFITKGRALYSDMGRVLCSMTEDTSGWHDTVCGTLDRPRMEAKYGQARYQERRNAYHRSGLDSFLVELGKWGLGKQDLVPNLNLFSKVTAGEEGELQFQPGHAKAGAFVDLRAEMNVLVVVHTSPHPLDPATVWAPKPLQLVVWRSDPPGPDDLCRKSRPENERGFANTERYFL
jgi:urea carboxylase-associated protein 2